MPQQHDKEELIAELARARGRFSEKLVALRRDLDFSTRSKKAFKTNPLPWLAGAAIVGLLLARLTSRKSAPKKTITFRSSAAPAVEKAGKAGLVLGLTKMVLDFARPAVTAWARKRVADYVAARKAQGDLRR
jgi:hypothetical protein